MAKLSLQHIYKIYDNGTKAVNDFNLEISDDEFVVFVGPSGCGKSTTLRMIAGLEDITAGDFYIDGQLANQLEPKDRDMAMVFQNYALYPHMTVYENMAFGLKIRHVPKAEIDQRVNEAAKVLNIADQLTKKPKAMSGGQRQRVALGRAIVRKPKVFLLDEPLSNLDAKLRSSMRSEIIRLHNVLQTTFIYVTHDQVEAMTMGSKIVVMKDGVIQQVDTPMNLYDYPSNVFVAGFIGTPQMNFLDGKLSLKGGNICLIIGDEVLETPMDTFAKLDLLNAYLQKEVKIGIRPEHLFISKDDKNTIKGTISIVEALGNETNIIVDTKGNHRIVLKILRDDSLQVGDEINIGFNFEKVHLFDKEKENTLLNRIPGQMTYKGKIDKGVLSVAGIKIKLSPSLKDKVEGQKDVYVVIPSHAIIEGKDYSLPITNKDNINKKWLNTLGEKDNSIFLLTDEYQYGDKYEFSIMQEELTILANDFSTLVEPIEKDNTVDGKLIPNKRPIYYYKGTMLSENDKKRIIDEELAKGNKEPKIKQKKYRLFNYQIFNQEITPEDESVIKIYSLLGKKFDLHDIKFIISANDVTISEEPSNITATIKEAFDYGINKYYLVESEGQSLIVKDCQNNKTVGEQVNLTLKNDHIGVYDVNFGVKLL